MSEERISKPKINRLPSLPPPYEPDRVGRSSNGGVVRFFVYSFAVLLACVITFVGYRYMDGLFGGMKALSEDEYLLNLVNSGYHTAKKGGLSLYFEDGGEVIVGQIIKVMSELEVTYYHNPMINNSESAGKELIRIINRY